MLLLPALASADTFWDVPAEQAAALARELRRGDLLLRWCPGCGDDVVVYTVLRDRVAPGTYSDGQQVQVRWKARAYGPGTDTQAVFGGEPACVETLICLADPEAPCAGRWAYVDIPYTWKRTADGTWVWLGATVGMESQSTWQEAPIAADPAWLQRAATCPAVPGRAPPME